MWAHQRCVASSVHLWIWPDRRGTLNGTDLTLWRTETTSTQTKIWDASRRDSCQQLTTWLTAHSARSRSDFFTSNERSISNGLWKVMIVPLFFEPNNAKILWRVEVCYRGRAPGEKPSLRSVPGSVTSIEVDAPFHSWMDSICTKTEQRDTHFAIPETIEFVDAGGVIKTRIPAHIVKWIFV